MKIRSLWARWFDAELLRRVLSFAALFGVLAHGCMLFNKFSWHDDLAHLFHIDINTAVKMGRWLRAILGAVVAKLAGGANLSLPLIHGAASILLIGLSAYTVIRLLDIEGRVPQALLCGLMEAIPVVTATFAYMFTAPYYFLALLLSVLGVFIAIRMNALPGYAIASVCICCAMGLYQAYVAVAVSLFVIVLIFDTFDGKFPGAGHLIGRGVWYAGTCVCALAEYAVVWQVCLRVRGVRISNYQGISSVQSSGLAAYLKRIPMAYQRFFLSIPRKIENLYPNGLRYVQIVVLALCALCSVYLVLRRWKESRLQAALMALLIALLPLCFNLEYLFGAENLHTLMLYGQCMLYVYLACAVLRMLRGGAKPGVAVYRLAAVTLAVMLCMDAYYDNSCYLKAEVQQQQTISDMTVLVSRIQSVEGYKDTMPVCLYKVKKGHEDATRTSDPELSDIGIMGIASIPPNAKANPTAYLMNCVNVMARWCGFSPKIVDPSDFDRPDVLEDMPYYPDDGSIRIVDDTIVVKM